MTIPHDPAWLGRRVIYQSYPGALPERGTLTSFATTGRDAFVRYDGDRHAKLTRLEDLTPES